MDPIACGLPHRPPFLFVDEVTTLTPSESAEGYKVFLSEEPFFAGHFPGDPIVPGVILSEALAQVAGLAVARPGLRLAALRSMKFPAAARPGERIDLSAKKIGEVGGLYQFSVVAKVGQTVVAEGGIVLGGG